MCSNNSGSLLPYGIKVPNGATFSQFHAMSGMTQAAFDYHRAQLYDYASRLPYGIRGYPMGALPYHGHPQDPLTHAFLYKHDPRARFIHEEPKPSHSYIGLIAMAILSHKEHKLVLSDIYQWILDNYAYFRARGPGWRNSIRHNLSLNDCFIKSGRSANGKGHYWAIHPANIDDFKKGDFRRRRAQRRVRKHMGLSVPDDEDSPSPPPSSTSPPWPNPTLFALRTNTSESKDSNDSSDHSLPSIPQSLISPPVAPPVSRKRLFDVESLLAPDDVDTKPKRVCPESPSQNINDESVPDNTEVDEDDECDVVNINNESDYLRDKSPFTERKILNASNQEDKDIEDSQGSPRSSPVDCTVRKSCASVSETQTLTLNSHRPWPIAGLAWPREGPSAFYSATPNTAIAWTTLSPHGYPIMTAPFSARSSSSSTSGSNISAEIAAAQQWQETFNKIMVKSYEHQKLDMKTEL